MQNKVNIQIIIDNPLARIVNVGAICAFTWVISRGGGPDAYAGLLLSTFTFLALEYRLFKQVTKKPTYRRSDTKIFDWIHIEALPSGGVIAFLRRNDFRGAFNVRFLDDLYKFVGESSNDPNKKFLDENLERDRTILLKECKKFISMVGSYTSGDGEILRVPTELRDAIHYCDTPESRSKLDLYQDRTSELNNSADLICKAYDRLTENARRSLMVDQE